MALRAKAQRLTTQIAEAREKAGLAPIRFNPDTLTLRQVEATADALNVPLESLLLMEPAG